MDFKPLNIFTQKNNTGIYKTIIITNFKLN